MDLNEYLDQMNKIQSNILDYIENEENEEENFNSLQTFFDSIKIQSNKHDICMIFHIVISIGNNHHRNYFFWPKIEKILSYFTTEYKKNFTNSELFDIFSKNKRILLFFIEAKIIIFDKYVIKKIETKYYQKDYLKYFSPEFKSLYKRGLFPKGNKQHLRYEYGFLFKEIKDNFYTNRRLGENDDKICQIIRKDSLDEFIIYVNKNNYPLDSNIEKSVYETNSFLNQKEISLIEYAAFHGSIQIFKYLKINRVKINSKLFICAIHGNNPEIIHILEENNVESSDDMNQIYFNEIYFTESMKCHHNNMANYILEQYLNNKPSNYVINQSIKYYNFAFISTLDHSKSKDSFFYFCKYGYNLMVKYLILNKEIDVNAITIK